MVPLKPLCVYDAFFFHCFPLVLRYSFPPLPPPGHEESYRMTHDKEQTRGGQEEVLVAVPTWDGRLGP